MEYSKIKDFQDQSEDLSWEDIAEIQEAFDKIPDEQLSDLRENAMVDDMLRELETNASPLERAIYEYVSDNYGKNEAMDPSWAIGPLAAHLSKEFKL